MSWRIMGRLLSCPASNVTRKRRDHGWHLALRLIIHHEHLSAPPSSLHSSLPRHLPLPPLLFKAFILTGWRSPLLLWACTALTLTTSRWVFWPLVPDLWALWPSTSDLLLPPAGESPERGAGSEGAGRRSVPVQEAACWAAWPRPW